jgi:hypothetical protein
MAGGPPFYCPVLGKEEADGGEMIDWVPVLIMALVVVCVTAYLLLEPKLRPPREDR